MVKQCFVDSQALPASGIRSDNPSVDTQAHKLAEKIRFLLDNDFVQHSTLAAACGVSKRALTGWKRTGRVAKQHLQVIADMSGVTVPWLISADPPTQEAVVALRAPKPRWPFRSVTWERYLALSRADKDDLDARLERIVSAYEATDSQTPRKSPAGHSSG